MPSDRALKPRLHFCPDEPRRDRVVHCRQGVGRAGLIAVALLIEAGLGPDNCGRPVLILEKP